MKISGCLMVKNEEKNIRKCIESFKDVVHEIIVVDTGSTDRTVEIAKEYGAKMFYTEWNNDFSTPRNIALDNAEGDWIIFLDADEYFYGTTGRNIPLLIEQIDGDKSINALICKLVNIDTSDPDMKEKSSSHVIRIFRNDEKIRFKNKIHECVYNDNEIMRSCVVNNNDLFIHHTGYSSEVTASKYERNLKILLEEEANSECREMNDYYIGDCYYGLKQYDLAIKYMQKYLDTGYINLGFNVKPYSVIVESMISLKYDYSILIGKINEAIEKYPKHPQLYRDKAAILVLNNKFSEAIKVYEKTIELQLNYDDVEANGVTGIMFSVYYNLACLFDYKTDYIKAIEYLIKSLKEKYDFTDAFQLLIKIIKNEKPEEIVILLKSIYDENNEKHMEFLISELSHFKLGKVLMYYENIWYSKFKKSDSNIMFALLTSSNYDEAFKNFFKCYTEDWGYSLEMFSLISALLSKNQENIHTIKELVKPSFKRIIEAYTGEKNIIFINKDEKDYKKLLQEFLYIKGMNNEETEKLINLSAKFKDNIDESIGDLFMENRLNQRAIKQYEKALINGISENKLGYMNFKVAINYFRLSNYEKSLEYIEKALGNNYKNNELCEYLKWINELSKNGYIKNKAEQLYFC